MPKWWPKIVEAKLGWTGNGKSRLYIFGDQEPGRIRIHRRLRGLIRLDTLIHELLHEFNPKWTERRVKRTATRLAKILWSQGYRRVDYGF